MLNSARLVVIRSILPPKWRISRQAAAEALNRFAEVEADSAWQYYNAMYFTSDSRLTGMLFRNVVEEMGHADAFQRVANRLSSQRFRPMFQSRKPLVTSSPDINSFLAFAHESERAIGGQFATYAKACPLPEVKEVFERIATEEVDHQLEALVRLESLLASPHQSGWLLFRARLRRGLEQWERLGEQLSAFFFGILLGAFYLVSGLFLSQYCRNAGAKRP
jgi:rubrerythrin